MSKASYSLKKFLPSWPSWAN